MGCRAQPVRYPVPRTVQQMTRETRMGQPSYTEFRILPLVRLADQIKPHLAECHAVPVPWLLCELDTIVGENCLDLVGHCLKQVL